SGGEDRAGVFGGADGSGGRSEDRGLAAGRTAAENAVEPGDGLAETEVEQRDVTHHDHHENDDHHGVGEQLAPGGPADLAELADDLLGEGHRTGTTLRTLLGLGVGVSLRHLWSLRSWRAGTAGRTARRRFRDRSAS